jgi:hypothetical protein
MNDDDNLRGTLHEVCWLKPSRGKNKQKHHGLVSMQNPNPNPREHGLLSPNRIKLE